MNMAEEDTSQKTGTLDFFINHSKKVMIGLICLAVLVSAGVIAAYLLKGSGEKKQEEVVDTVNPVVAEVGGEKVYLKEYKERGFAASGGLGTLDKPIIDENIQTSVLNDLGDLRIIEKELKKRNLSVTDAEVLAEAKKVFKDYDTKTADIQKVYKRYVLLRVERAKLTSAVVSWKEGYALICLFSRTDALDVKRDLDTAAVKARDKEYAASYCKAAKQRLETGQTKFEDELAKIKADPTLGDDRWKPMHMSMGFEIKKGDLFLGSYLPYDLSKKMSNTKNTYQFLTLNWPKDDGQADDIDQGEKLNTITATGGTQTSGQNQGGETEDVAYGVAHTTDGYNGETTDFIAWLRQKESQYNMKTYPERIKL